MDLLTRTAQVTGGDGLTDTEIDDALSVQLCIAWAGESGEDEPRLKWWRSDLISEFGGEDLFRQLLPNTTAWAQLQAAREVARRKDAERRLQDHDPDQIISIFHLGFLRDERIHERLQTLKQAGKRPDDALPLLKQVTAHGWSHDAFTAWARSDGTTEFVNAPAGRRLKGAPPAQLSVLLRRLVSALTPLATTYPLPHFRQDKA